MHSALTGVQVLVTHIPDHIPFDWHIFLPGKGVPDELHALPWHDLG
jgi:hypothetical protein